MHDFFSIYYSPLKDDIILIYPIKANLVTDRMAIMATLINEHYYFIGNSK